MFDKLIIWLFSDRKHLLPYVLTRSAVGWLSQALVATIFTMADLSIRTPPDKNAKFLFVFTSVVAAPIIENIFVILAIDASRFFTKNSLVAATLAASLLASLHGLISIPFGISVFLPFFVMSSSYLGNINRGRIDAYLTTVLIHALHNIPAAALFIYL